MSDEENVVSGSEVEEEVEDVEEEEEEESGSARKQRKAAYRAKLLSYFNKYNNLIIIGIDNVGSRQMQIVRQSLRGKAEMLMGKNTIIRKVLRELADENDKLEDLIPLVRGNVGFVFSDGDLNEIRKLILENKVPASAKTGAIAPVDVFVPAGPTGMDPGQTNFFQALNIATKISKGSIEIINKVHLVKKDEKVSASAVALLVKLGIKPFFYGIACKYVYEDGSVYAADILDLTDADMLNKFFNGVRHVASLSLAIGQPNAASLPHIVTGAFKKMVAISLQTDYVFEEAKMYKAMVGDDSDSEDEEEEEEEEEADEESDTGGGLFEADKDDE